MKKKEKALSENYLERIPKRFEGLKWSTDEQCIVTLEIENKGIVNRMAQKLLKKPRISYIHLDAMGSFIWPMLDGEKSILDLGSIVEAHFGDEAKPLYERLAKYFQILDSYHFIEWVEK